MTLSRRALFAKAQFVWRRVRHGCYYSQGLVSDTVTVRTRQGRLTIPTRDRFIGLALYRDGQFEFDYSVRALRFLRQSGFVAGDQVNLLDVGANIGMIGIGLVLAGEVSLVLAVEPEPANFALLCRNVGQNRLADRILCLPVAVGDRAARLTMELSPSNVGDHRVRQSRPSLAPELADESMRRTIEVDSLPLPHILQLSQVVAAGLATPSCLWIDIQGYEGYVFAGARELLMTGIPAVAEIWPYAILRAGMPLATFVDIVASIWTHYWVDRRGRFVRYPVSVLASCLDEIGTDGDLENVIFTGPPRSTPRPAV